MEIFFPFNKSAPHLKGLAITIENVTILDENIFHDHIKSLIRKAVGGTVRMVEGRAGGFQLSRPGELRNTCKISGQQVKSKKKPFWWSEPRGPQVGGLGV